MKDLLELLNVGGEIEVREYHALGFARRAARENNRSRVVERSDAAHAERPFDEARWKQTSRKQSRKLFGEPRVFGEVLDVNDLSGRLNMHFFEEQSRRDR